MKTTLDIDAALVGQAKSLAALNRTSLTRLIEEGLELRLRAAAAKPGKAAKAASTALPLFRPSKPGKAGLVPGLNPLSNKALLEALGDDA